MLPGIPLGGVGATPMLPASRLAAPGSRLALWPRELQRAAIHARAEGAATRRRAGSPGARGRPEVSFEARLALAGTDR